MTFTSDTDKTATRKSASDVQFTNCILSQKTTGRISRTVTITRTQLLKLSYDKYSISTCRNIALAILRGIKDTPARIRKTRTFVREVCHWLTILNNYNRAATEIKGKYPFSKALLYLLVAYVQLEHHVLYYQENHSAEYAKEVERRVLRMLHVMLDGAEKKLGYKNTENAVSKCALRVLNKVSAEYKEEGKLVCSLITKLLKRVGLWETVTKIQENAMSLFENNFTLETLSCDIDYISDCDSDDSIEYPMSPTQYRTSSPFSDKLKLNSSVKLEPPHLDSGQESLLLDRQNNGLFYLKNKSTDYSSDEDDYLDLKKDLVNNSVQIDHNKNNFNNSDNNSVAIKSTNQYNSCGGLRLNKRISGEWLISDDDQSCSSNYSLCDDVSVSFGRSNNSRKNFSDTSKITRNATAGSSIPIIDLDDEDDDDDDDVIEVIEEDAPSEYVRNSQISSPTREKLIFQSTNFTNGISARRKEFQHEERTAQSSTALAIEVPAHSRVDSLWNMHVSEHDSTTHGERRGKEFEYGEDASRRSAALAPEIPVHSRADSFWTLHFSDAAENITRHEDNRREERAFEKYTSEYLLCKPVNENSSQLRAETRSKIKDQSEGALLTLNEGSSSTSDDSTDIWFNEIRRIHISSSNNSTSKMNSTQETFISNTNKSYMASPTDLFIGKGHYLQRLERKNIEDNQNEDISSKNKDSTITDDNEDGEENIKDKFTSTILKSNTEANSEISSSNGAQEVIDDAPTEIKKLLLQNFESTPSTKEVEGTLMDETSMSIVENSAEPPETNQLNSLVAQDADNAVEKNVRSSMNVTSKIEKEHVQQQLGQENIEDVRNQDVVESEELKSKSTISSKGSTKYVIQEITGASLPPGTDQVVAAPQVETKKLLGASNSEEIDGESAEILVSSVEISEEILNAAAAKPSTTDEKDTVAGEGIEPSRNVFKISFEKEQNLQEKGLEQNQEMTETSLSSETEQIFSSPDAEVKKLYEASTSEEIEAAEILVSNVEIPEEIIHAVAAKPLATQEKHAVIEEDIESSINVFHTSLEKEEILQKGLEQNLEMIETSLLSESEQILASREGMKKLLGASNTEEIEEKSAEMFVSDVEIPGEILNVAAVEPLITQEQHTVIGEDVEPFRNVFNTSLEKEQSLREGLEQNHEIVKTSLSSESEQVVVDSEEMKKLLGASNPEETEGKSAEILVSNVKISEGFLHPAAAKRLTTQEKDTVVGEDTEPSRNVFNTSLEGELVETSSPTESEQVAVLPEEIKKLLGSSNSEEIEGKPAEILVSSVKISEGFLYPAATKPLPTQEKDTVVGEDTEPSESEQVLAGPEEMKKLLRSSNSEEIEGKSTEILVSSADISEEILNAAAPKPLTIQEEDMVVGQDIEPSINEETQEMTQTSLLPESQQVLAGPEEMNKLLGPPNSEEIQRKSAEILISSVEISEEIRHPAAPEPLTIQENDTVVGQDIEPSKNVFNASLEKEEDLQRGLEQNQEMAETLLSETEQVLACAEEIERRSAEILVSSVEISEETVNTVAVKSLAIQEKDTVVGKDIDHSRNVFNTSLEKEQNLEEELEQNVEDTLKKDTLDARTESNTTPNDNLEEEGSITKDLNQEVSEILCLPDVQHVSEESSTETRNLERKRLEISNPEVVTTSSIDETKVTVMNDAKESSTKPQGEHCPTLSQVPISTNKNLQKPLNVTVAKSLVIQEENVLSGEDVFSANVSSNIIVEKEQELQQLEQVNIKDQHKNEDSTVFEKLSSAAISKSLTAIGDQKSPETDELQQVLDLHFENMPDDNITPFSDFPEHDINAERKMQRPFTASTSLDHDDSTEKIAIELQEILASTSQDDLGKSPRLKENDRLFADCSELDQELILPDDNFTSAGSKVSESNLHRNKPSRSNEDNHQRAGEPILLKEPSQFQVSELRLNHEKQSETTADYSVNHLEPKLAHINVEHSEAPAKLEKEALNDENVMSISDLRSDDDTFRKLSETDEEIISSTAIAITSDKVDQCVTKIIKENETNTLENDVEKVEPEQITAEFQLKGQIDTNFKESNENVLGDARLVRLDVQPDSEIIEDKISTASVEEYSGLGDKETACDEVTEDEKELVNHDVNDNKNEGEKSVETEFEEADDTEKQVIDDSTSETSHHNDSPSNGDAQIANISLIVDKASQEIAKFDETHCSDLDSKGCSENGTEPEEVSNLDAEQNTGNNQEISLSINSEIINEDKVKDDLCIDAKDIVVNDGEVFLILQTDAETKDDDFLYIIDTDQLGDHKEVNFVFEGENIEEETNLVTVENDLHIQASSAAEVETNVGDYFESGDIPTTEDEVCVECCEYQNNQQQNDNVLVTDDDKNETCKDLVTSKEDRVSSDQITNTSSEEVAEINQTSVEDPSCSDFNDTSIVNEHEEEVPKGVDDCKEFEVEDALRAAVTETEIVESISAENGISDAKASIITQDFTEKYAVISGQSHGDNKSPECENEGAAVTQNESVETLQNETPIVTVTIESEHFKQSFDVPLENIDKSTEDEAIAGELHALQTYPNEHQADFDFLENKHIREEASGRENSAFYQTSLAVQETDEGGFFTAKNKFDINFQQSFGHTDNSDMKKSYVIQPPAQTEKGADIAEEKLFFLATVAAAQESLKIAPKDPKEIQTTESSKVDPKDSLKGALNKSLKVAPVDAKQVRSRVKMAGRSGSKSEKNVKPNEITENIPNQPANTISTTTTESDVNTISEDSSDSFLSGKLIIAEDSKHNESSPAYSGNEYQQTNLDGSIFDEDTVEEKIEFVKTTLDDIDGTEVQISISDSEEFQAFEGFFPYIDKLRDTYTCRREVSNKFGAVTLKNIEQLKEPVFLENHPEETVIPEQNLSTDLFEYAEEEEDLRKQVAETYSANNEGPKSTTKPSNYNIESILKSQFVHSIELQEVFHGKSEIPKDVAPEEIASKSDSSEDQDDALPVLKNVIEVRKATIAKESSKEKNLAKENSAVIVADSMLSHDGEILGVDDGSEKNKKGAKFENVKENRDIQKLAATNEDLTNQIINNFNKIMSCDGIDQTIPHPGLTSTAETSNENVVRHHIRTKAELKAYDKKCNSKRDLSEAPTEIALSPEVPDDLGQVKSVSDNKDTENDSKEKDVPINDKHLIDDITQVETDAKNDDNKVSTPSKQLQDDVQISFNSDTADIKIKYSSTPDTNLDKNNLVVTSVSEKSSKDIANDTVDIDNFENPMRIEDVVISGDKKRLDVLKMDDAAQQTSNAQTDKFKLSSYVKLTRLPSISSNTTLSEMENIMKKNDFEFSISRKSYKSLVDNRALFKRTKNVGHHQQSKGMPRANKNVEVEAENDEFTSDVSDKRISLNCQKTVERSLRETSNKKLSDGNQILEETKQENLGRAKESSETKNVTGKGSDQYEEEQVLGDCKKSGAKNMGIEKLKRPNGKDKIVEDKSKSKEDVKSTKANRNSNCKATRSSTVHAKKTDSSEKPESTENETDISKQSVKSQIKKLDDQHAASAKFNKDIYATRSTVADRKSDHFDITEKNIRVTRATSGETRKMSRQTEECQTKKKIEEVNEQSSKVQDRDLINQHIKGTKVEKEGNRKTSRTSSVDCKKNNLADKDQPKEDKFKTEKTNEENIKTQSHTDLVDQNAVVPKVRQTYRKTRSSLSVDKIDNADAPERNIRSTKAALQNKNQNDKDMKNCETEKKRYIEKTLHVEIVKIDSSNVVGQNTQNTTNKSSSRIDVSEKLQSQKNTSKSIHVKDKIQNKHLNVTSVNVDRGNDGKVSSTSSVDIKKTDQPDEVNMEVTSPHNERQNKLESIRKKLSKFRKPIRTTDSARSQDLINEKAEVNHIKSESGISEVTSAVENGAKMSNNDDLKEEQLICKSSKSDIEKTVTLKVSSKEPKGELVNMDSTKRECKTNESLLNMGKGVTTLSTLPISTDTSVELKKLEKRNDKVQESDEKHAIQKQEDNSKVLQEKPQKTKTQVDNKKSKDKIDDAAEKEEEIPEKGRYKVKKNMKTLDNQKEINVEVFVAKEDHKIIESFQKEEGSMGARKDEEIIEDLPKVNELAEENVTTSKGEEIEDKNLVTTKDEDLIEKSQKGAECNKQDEANLAKENVDSLNEVQKKNSEKSEENSMRNKEQHEKVDMNEFSKTNLNEEVTTKKGNYNRKRAKDKIKKPQSPEKQDDKTSCQFISEKKKTDDEEVIEVKRQKLSKRDTENALPMKLEKIKEGKELGDKRAKHSKFNHDEHANKIETRRITAGKILDANTSSRSNTKINQSDSEQNLVNKEENLKEFSKDVVLAENDSKLPVKQDEKKSHLRKIAISKSEVFVSLERIKVLDDKILESISVSAENNFLQSKMKTPNCDVSKVKVPKKTVEYDKEKLHTGDGKIELANKDDKLVLEIDSKVAEETNEEKPENASIDLKLQTEDINILEARRDSAENDLLQSKMKDSSCDISKVNILEKPEEKSTVEQSKETTPTDDGNVELLNKEDKEKHLSERDSQVDENYKEDEPENANVDLKLKTEEDILITKFEEKALDKQSLIVDKNESVKLQEEEANMNILTKNLEVSSKFVEEITSKEANAESTKAKLDTSRTKEEANETNTDSASTTAKLTDDKTEVTPDNVKKSLDNVEHKSKSEEKSKAKVSEDVPHAKDEVLKKYKTDTFKTIKAKSIIKRDRLSIDGISGRCGEIRTYPPKKRVTFSIKDEIFNESDAKDPDKAVCKNHLISSNSTEAIDLKPALKRSNFRNKTVTEEINKIDDIKLDRKVTEKVIDENIDLTEETGVLKEKYLLDREDVSMAAKEIKPSVKTATRTKRKSPEEPETSPVKKAKEQGFPKIEIEKLKMSVKHKLEMNMSKEPSVTSPTKRKDGRKKDIDTIINNLRNRDNQKIDSNKQGSNSEEKLEITIIDVIDEQKIKAVEDIKSAIRNFESQKGDSKESPADTKSIDAITVCETLIQEEKKCNEVYPGEDVNVSQIFTTNDKTNKIVEDPNKNSLKTENVNQNKQADSVTPDVAVSEETIAISLKDSVEVATQENLKLEEKNDVQQCDIIENSITETVNHETQINHTMEEAPVSDHIPTIIDEEVTKTGDDTSSTSTALDDNASNSNSQSLLTEKEESSETPEVADTSSAIKHINTEESTISIADDSFVTSTPIKTVLKGDGNSAGTTASKNIEFMDGSDENQQSNASTSTANIAEETQAEICPNTDVPETVDNYLTDATTSDNSLPVSVKSACLNDVPEPETSNREAVADVRQHKTVLSATDGSKPEKITTELSQTSDESKAIDVNFSTASVLDKNTLSNSSDLKANKPKTVDEFTPCITDDSVITEVVVSAAAQLTNLISWPSVTVPEPFLYTPDAEQSNTIQTEASMQGNIFTNSNLQLFSSRIVETTKEVDVPHKIDHKPDILHNLDGKAQELIPISIAQVKEQTAIDKTSKASAPSSIGYESTHLSAMTRQISSYVSDQMLAINENELPVTPENTTSAPGKSFDPIDEDTLLTDKLKERGSIRFGGTSDHDYSVGLGGPFLVSTEDNDNIFPFSEESVCISSLMSNNLTQEQDERGSTEDLSNSPVDNNIFPSVCIGPFIDHDLTQETGRSLNHSPVEGANNYQFNTTLTEDINSLIDDLREESLSVAQMNNLMMDNHHGNMLNNLTVDDHHGTNLAVSHIAMIGAENRKYLSDFDLEDQENIISRIVSGENIRIPHHQSSRGGTNETTSVTNEPKSETATLKVEVKYNEHAYQSGDRIKNVVCPDTPQLNKNDMIQFSDGKNDQNQKKKATETVEKKPLKKQSSEEQESRESTRTFSALRAQAILDMQKKKYQTKPKNTHFGFPVRQNSRTPVCAPVKKDSPPQHKKSPEQTTSQSSSTSSPDKALDLPKSQPEAIEPNPNTPENSAGDTKGSTTEKPKTQLDNTKETQKVPEKPKEDIVETTKGKLNDLLDNYFVIGKARSESSKINHNPLSSSLSVQRSMASRKDAYTLSQQQPQSNSSRSQTAKITNSKQSENISSATTATSATSKSKQDPFEIAKQNDFSIDKYDAIKAKRRQCPDRLINNLVTEKLLKIEEDAKNRSRHEESKSKRGKVGRTKYRQLVDYDDSSLSDEQPVKFDKEQKKNERGRTTLNKRTADSSTDKLSSKRTKLLTKEEEVRIGEDKRYKRSVDSSDEEPEMKERKKPWTEAEVNAMFDELVKEGTAKKDETKLSDSKTKILNYNNKNTSSASVSTPNVRHLQNSKNPTNQPSNSLNVERSSLQDSRRDIRTYQTKTNPNQLPPSLSVKQSMPPRKERLPNIRSYQSSRSSTSQQQTNTPAIILNQHQQRNMYGYYGSQRHNSRSRNPLPGSRYACLPENANTRKSTDRSRSQIGAPQRYPCLSNVRVGNPRTSDAFAWINNVSPYLPKPPVTFGNDQEDQ